MFFSLNPKFSYYKNKKMKTKKTKTKILMLVLLLLVSIKTNAQCTGNVVIPDVNFKTSLLDNTAINTVDDGEISCTEAAAFTGEIDLVAIPITNLTGIEAFINLTRLNCVSNGLSSIDVTQNMALITLTIRSNNLTEIDVSNNTNLQALSIIENDLIEIDVSNNINLTILNVIGNDLTSLDVSQQTAFLNALSFDRNDLTEIEVSHLTNLISLRFSDNQITELDISNNINLDRLDCSYNNLISLDISPNTKLRRIKCDNNNLIELKLTNANSSDILTNIFTDFTNNPNLGCIEVDDVAFANANWADLKDADAEYSENCEECIVDIPDANFKAELINNNAININNDAEISCVVAGLFTGEINVFNKGISDLTGIEAFVNLTSLNCGRNSLTSLDVSNSTALVELYCNINDIESLDVTALTALTFLELSSNQISSYSKLAKLPKLGYINLENNKVTDGTKQNASFTRKIKVKLKGNPTK